MKGIEQMLENFVLVTFKVGWWMILFGILGVCISVLVSWFVK